MKPHTTKVACFQICEQIRERWRCHCSLIFLHNPSLGGWTAFLPFSQNSDTYAAKDISSALRLINVDNVLVLAEQGDPQAIELLAEYDRRIAYRKKRVSEQGKAKRRAEKEARANMTLITANA